MGRKYCETNQSTRRERETSQATLRTLRHTETLAKKRTTTPDACYSQTAQDLLSNDTSQIFQGIYEFRTLLSSSNTPPIDEVLKTNLLPRFVELLSKDHFSYKNVNEQLIKATRLEAAWVLTNIASGNSQQTSAVVECGAIPLLLDFSKEDEECLDQSVWCLGNIAGDSDENRNAILKSDTNLILNFLKIKNKNILKNVVWMVSNLCRGKDEVFLKKAYFAILEFLVRFRNFGDKEIGNENSDKEIGNENVNEIGNYIDNEIDISNQSVNTNIDQSVNTTNINIQSNNINITQTDTQIITDSLWGLAYALSSVPNLCTVEHLCFLLNFNISGPLIRILGNLSTGDDRSSLVVLESNGISFLFDFYFQNYAGKPKKEVCWALSNLCVIPLSVECISNFVLPVFIDGLNCNENYVKLEAGWGICNLMNLQNNLILEEVCRSGFFGSVRKYLRICGSELLFQILCGFKRMLKMVSFCCLEMEKCGVWDVLEELSMREDSVGELASELVESFQ